jgi:2-methylisocitrate lyase-like PEP mutase family enzyme
MVRRIAAGTSLPVTADLEAGYGPDPEDAAETARQAIAAGAVGLNFEDGTGDPARPLVEVPMQVARIRAIVEAGRAAGVPLVVNARADVFLDQVGDPAGRLAETVRRGRAYREAGADCVFVPGVRDAATIGALVRDIGAPINVLVGPGTPSVADLARLGVARVSLGSATQRAAMGLLRRIATEVFGAGTFAHATEGAIPYAEMNDLLRG